MPPAVWKKTIRADQRFREDADREQRLHPEVLPAHEQQGAGARRFDERLADPRKNWKASPADFKEREYWDEYQDAYQDAIAKCSTKDAPWYVIPSDHKWFRNFAVAEVIVRTLESFKMRYPEGRTSRHRARKAADMKLEDNKFQMSLDIAQREREGIALLDLKGRITMGDEASRFSRRLSRRCAAEPGARLILNMQEVDYVDSTGLGAHRSCAPRGSENANGVAKLVNVNRRNIELIVMTKIDTIFEVFDDETDAVNSFFPGREIKRFDILSFVAPDAGRIRSERCFSTGARGARYRPA